MSKIARRDVLAIVHVKTRVTLIMRLICKSEDVLPLKVVNEVTCVAHG